MCLSNFIISWRTVFQGSHIIFTPTDKIRCSTFSPFSASFFSVETLLVSPCPSQLWLRPWGEGGSWGGDSLGVVYSQDIAPTGANQNLWVMKERATGSHGPGLGRGCLWFPQALVCLSLPEWGTPRAQGECELWVGIQEYPCPPGSMPWPPSPEEPMASSWWMDFSWV